MGEQPHPEPTPRSASPGGTARPGGIPDPHGRNPRRTLAQRVRGLSTTTKVIYAGAAVFIAAVVIIAVTGAATGKPKPAPLPMAKNFTLAALGDPGHTVSLAQYAGHPLVINFWASWCTPCRRETPLIASYYKHMSGKVIVIGIDADDTASNGLKFMQKAGVAYPVGFEPTPGVADSYGVVATPQTFFLNAHHRIVEHIYGAVTLKELTQGVTLMDSSRPPTSVVVRGQDKS
jgi:thiol-disulfide isomerase/thioredoxin